MGDNTPMIRQFHPARKHLNSDDHLHLKMSSEVVYYKNQCKFWRTSPDYLTLTKTPVDI